MSDITANASQIVLIALLARQKNKSVFTAYDVTIDARDMTTVQDNYIDHTEVQRIVHEEYNTGQFPPNYNREDMLEMNNSQYAICYYPDGKTAEDHPNAMNHGITTPAHVSHIPSAMPSNYVAPSTVLPTNPVVPKQGGSVKDGGGYICTETSKKVINIPEVIVKGVTPNGGNLYDISIKGGNVIYKAPDGQGRLRIASSKLGGGSTFRMEVVNNTITVEQI